MLICSKCKRTFDEPAKQYDDVGYSIAVCPYCEHDEICFAEPCKQCSEPKPKNYEAYCNNCKEQADKAVRRAIEILVSTDYIDRELVLDTLEVILNE